MKKRIFWGTDLTMGAKNPFRQYWKFRSFQPILALFFQPACWVFLHTPKKHTFFLRKLNKEKEHNSRQVRK